MSDSSESVEQGIPKPDTQVSKPVDLPKDPQLSTTGEIPEPPFQEPLEVITPATVEVDDSKSPVNGIKIEADKDKGPTDETKAAVDERLDYLNKLAELVLAGQSQPSALQNYVDYSIENGVPRGRIEAVLRARGIPITEKPASPTVVKPQFDAQKPIDGKTYNALSKRFNDVRTRLLQEGNRGKLDRLNGVPIGRILNGPFLGGDTLEARLAYNQISDLLDEVEGIGPPQPEQTDVVQPSTKV